MKDIKTASFDNDKASNMFAFIDLCMDSFKPSSQGQGMGFTTTIHVKDFHKDIFVVPSP